MVVGLALAAVQMGMALPTGFLFGVGYGTGVRIGYEQVYPLLFPKGARPTTTELAATMKGMNTVYDAIGGKDASRMGIAVGITNAGEILNNPDFRVLEQLESSSSGPTSSNSNRSRYGLDQESAQEEVSSDINKFNITSGADAYQQFRAFTITQIQNWLTGTGHDPFKRSIAIIVLNEKFQLQNINYQTPVKQTLTSTFKDPKNLATTPEALTWISTRDTALAAYKQAKKQAATLRRVNKSANSQINIYTNAMKTLRRLSNDYRHPNNFIRTQALVLRKLLQTL